MRAETPKSTAQAAPPVRRIGDVASGRDPKPRHDRPHFAPMARRPTDRYCRSMSQSRMSGAPADVVIVGGGVAAVESLIALRDLAGERVRITLVAPAPDFVYRPMLVGEPFGGGEARHHALREIAADFDAVVVQAAVVAVDAPGRRVICRSGTTIRYDSLVLAPGARVLEAFEDAIAFGRKGPARPWASSWSDSRPAMRGAWRSSSRPGSGGAFPCMSSR
jgi:thioredoxin reductase